MRLKRFTEHSTDNDYKKINFNENELKLLSAKGILNRIMHNIYVNCKYVSKLASGEYLVENDKVICSTISSLIKYTANSIKPASDYIDEMLMNMDIAQSTWVYKGKIIAFKNSATNKLEIHSTLFSKFDLFRDEVIFLLKDRIKAILGIYLNIHLK